MNVSPKRACASSSSTPFGFSTYSGNLGERHVILNIPAAQIETVEGGRVSTRPHGGGGQDRPPVADLNTRVSEVNFHPFWDHASSSSRRTSSPKCGPSRTTSREPHPLYNGANQEIPPFVGQLALQRGDELPLPAGPGRLQLQGTVRINIPNPHGCYMHDTNSKGLFGDEQRFHSSGCVRVQNVRDYVAGSSGDTPGMTREVVDEAFASGRRLDVKVADPVAVYWAYITAWATPDGLVQFRDDIYNRDGLGAMAMRPAISTSRRHWRRRRSSTTDSGPVREGSARRPPAGVDGHGRGLDQPGGDRH
jgi:murein L,D-transpeptidase YcbB/YkuD